MAQPDRYQPYIFKKLIVEIRHHPNLLHSQKAQTVLNDLVNHFDRVVVGGIEGGEKTFELLSEKSFVKLLLQWNRMGLTVENCSDIGKMLEFVKRYLAPIPTKLSINLFTRLGVRTTFLIPFEGKFAELVDLCEDKFYKDKDLLGTLGEVYDIGLVALKANDERYKINITIGPFTREEFRDKISEFKHYEDKFGNALMVDIDSYQDERKNYKVSSFVEDAVNSARLKFLNFQKKFAMG